MQMHKQSKNVNHDVSMNQNYIFIFRIGGGGCIESELKILPIDYLAIASKIHKYLNIHPKKIIIAGDSAGGNLAFSLTGLIMR